MADLLDITPSTACEVVKINGTRIIVRGLRFNSVASIVARFPNIVGCLLGGLSVADFTSRFIAQFGDAVGPLIAAGCGHPGDEKYERFATNELLLEDQVRLVAVTIRLTCPNGFGFFVEAAAKLMGVKDEEAKVYKMRLRKSPSPLHSSSDEASHQIM